MSSNLIARSRFFNQISVLAAFQRLRGVRVRVERTLASIADVETRADFVYNKRDEAMYLHSAERQWLAVPAPDLAGRRHNYRRTGELT